jgi:hypothetical protein
MGIALAWVAVQGNALDAILGRLELDATPATCTYPFEGVAAHPLPADAWLIAARGCDHRITGAASMAALSVGGRALCCNIEEHVNYASCALWEEGRQVWRVEHAGDEAADHIAVEGDPPARFYALQADVERGDGTGAEVDDHMEIPLILAQEFCGYRHDGIDPGFDAVPFQVLADRRRALPWWRTFWR